MGNCMCRNTHQQDTNELKTLTPRRYSQSEMTSGVDHPEPLHKRAQSSFSTNQTSILEGRSLPVSPHSLSPDIAEVSATLNHISVRLEQNAERDDRESHTGRIKKLIQHTQKMSAKLAVMQRVQTEVQGGNTCRSSIESHSHLNRLEDDLERQLHQLQAEMTCMLCEVEQLSKHTQALTTK